MSERTQDELQQLWASRHAGVPGDGAVRLICVRKGGGVHDCPGCVLVSSEDGIEGDRWRQKPERNIEEQVTLMSARVAEVVSDGVAPLDAAGDNFLVDFDLSESSLPVGAQLQIGGVRLEVSAKPHTGCKKFRDRFGLEALLWINAPETRHLRRRGVNCRVISGGVVTVGDRVEKL